MCRGISVRLIRPRHRDNPYPTCITVELRRRTSTPISSCARLYCCAAPLMSFSTFPVCAAWQTRSTNNCGGGQGGPSRRIGFAIMGRCRTTAGGARTNSGISSSDTRAGRSPLGGRASWFLGRSCSPLRAGGGLASSVEVAKPSGHVFGPRVTYLFVRWLVRSPAAAPRRRAQDTRTTSGPPPTATTS